MDLSIVIVNYNTKDLTLQTLYSVYNVCNEFSFEVFVVDNASSDDSVESIKKEFPQTIIIENNKNIGFSKANNIAIKEAKGKYLLLLNSDTVLEKDTLSIMLEYMSKNLDIGAAGGKVVLPDGSLDRACKRSFPTPQNALYNAVKLDKFFPDSKIFGKYNLTFLKENEMHEVDCLVGAFIMVRREVIEQVGLLDEDFFMYGEDIDWCYRIKQAGWKIMYYPRAKITHYKGGSSKKRKSKLIYEFYRAMFLFYNKHYKEKYPWFITIMTYLGIGFILILKLFLNFLKSFRGNSK